MGVAVITKYQNISQSSAIRPIEVVTSYTTSNYVYQWKFSNSHPAALVLSMNGYSLSDYGSFMSGILKGTTVEIPTWTGKNDKPFEYINVTVSFSSDGRIESSSNGKGNIQMVIGL